MPDVPRPEPATNPFHATRETQLALLLAVTLAAGAYVIVYPFTLVRYPPITDLPFHASEMSILRHYFDPKFHFREQFSLHPLEVPYLSMYVIGALFALVVPISVATKLMAIAMLALVPVGLAVLFYGMKKSPLWGLTGLGFIWCTVTQWGFLNFMGATGLFAMSIGFALLVADEPTKLRRLGLSLSLVAIFFTHVYRLPFALVGVLVAGALVYPATRRFAPIVETLWPALALFVIWLLVRPRALGIGIHEFGFHPERVSEILEHLFGAYLPVNGAPPTPEGILERTLGERVLGMQAFAVCAATLLFFVDGRAKNRSRRERLWAIGVTVLPVLFAGGLFLAYLTLPFESGLWFYIYPREMVASVMFLVAVAPDLPRSFVGRGAFALFLAAAAVPMSRFVSARFLEFEAATADFREIVAEVPAAPKLFYLMYWLGDSAKRVSPFLHLPAWIQAEKGGALDFHFVQWRHSPIRYRVGSPDVPPPLPQRFEWTPQYFDVLQQGYWFDTFLVRHRIDPHELFDADPAIHLVSHHGSWWLYRRFGK